MYLFPVLQWQYYSDVGSPANCKHVFSSNHQCIRFFSSMVRKHSIWHFSFIIIYTQIDCKICIWNKRSESVEQIKISIWNKRSESVEQIKPRQKMKRKAFIVYKLQMENRVILKATEQYIFCIHYMQLQHKLHTGCLGIILNKLRADWHTIMLPTWTHLVGSMPFQKSG